MSCILCDMTRKYMSADPEMYRGDDTRCEAHQRIAELEAAVEGGQVLLRTAVQDRERIAELEAKLAVAKQEERESIAESFDCEEHTRWIAAAIRYAAREGE